jgi:hypothetical protein
MLKLFAARGRIALTAAPGTAGRQDDLRGYKNKNLNGPPVPVNPENPQTHQNPSLIVNA